MSDSTQTLPPAFVPAGQDRFGEHRSLGVSAIEFKVCGQDSAGILVVENAFHQKGGPARHLHYEQDEWFHVIEGEFVFEVGNERFLLKPGDALFGPRRVPHVWAFIGEKRGRILIVLTRLGKWRHFSARSRRRTPCPL